MKLKRGIQLCSECKQTKKMNKALEIIRILQWKGSDNYLSALSFDKYTNQILINKDSLMRAIQMANPGQAYRDIRLVENEEFKMIGPKQTDYTSWNEKKRQEKMAHKKESSK